MNWMSLPVTQILASKAAVDKITLPQEAYQKFQEMLAEAESWASVLQSFDLKKPYTWIGSSVRVLKKASKSEVEIKVRSRSIIDDFLRSEEYDELENDVIRLIIRALLKDHEERLIHVYSDTPPEEGVRTRTLYYFPLSNGTGIYVVDNPEEDYDDARTYYMPVDHSAEWEDNVKLVACIEGISDLFWEDRNFIKLDTTDEGYVLKNVSHSTRKYEGVLNRYEDLLPKAKAQGVRRSILFQGEPGTGKSTLVSNLAEKISQRTVTLTHQFLLNCTEYVFNSFMFVLRPDMIIVDDIDRISRIMEQKLALFEDTYCKIPFILLTSNHYHQLPDAFKRPGRIDEIVEMEKPSQAIRYDVIRSISAQEGMEIPEDRFELFDRIYQEYSPAYLVEILRRAKCYGWNFKIETMDLTFRDLDASVKEEWNRLSGHEDSKEEEEGISE